MLVTIIQNTDSLLEKILGPQFVKCPCTLGTSPRSHIHAHTTGTLQIAVFVVSAFREFRSRTARTRPRDFAHAVTIRTCK